MSVYQDLQQRIQRLKDAEDDCASRGKLAAAWLWKKQRLDLEQIALALPPQVAREIYNPEIMAMHVVERIGAAIPVGALI
jgi:hypothetical protein